MRHGDIAAAPLPGIRKGRANGFQARQKGWQKLHPSGESFSQRFGNPQNQPQTLLLELLHQSAFSQNPKYLPGPAFWSGLLPIENATENVRVRGGVWRILVRIQLGSPVDTSPTSHDRFVDESSSPYRLTMGAHAALPSLKKRPTIRPTPPVARFASPWFLCGIYGRDALRARSKWNSSSAQSRYIISVLCEAST